jgi:hypothetical protein
MVFTMIVMVHTMVYIYGIYHDIYHLLIVYIPRYIPKVVYTTFGVVYTMRQPSRWRAARHGVLTAWALLSTPRAPPGGGHLGPESVEPEDRLVGQDPRIILRLVKGQSLARRIERESAKDIE